MLTTLYKILLRRIHWKWSIEPIQKCQHCQLCVITGKLDYTIKQAIWWIKNAIRVISFYLNTQLFIALRNKENSLFYILLKYELYIEVNSFTFNVSLLLLSGAFLIPYTIMLCFVGLPVFFIELSVGQYSASGPMTVFEASPIFQGVYLF